MKLVWSPETASKAYIDTVKSCEIRKDSGEAELISAMAGGWSAKVIAEGYLHGHAATAVSVGLSIAAHHSGGRHVCLVPDERSKLEYMRAIHEAGVSPAPEVIVGEVEEAVGGLSGIDFLVADGRRRDLGRLLRLAKLGPRGAVLVCRNSCLRSMAEFRWARVLGGTRRIVRSVELPIARGLDIAYVAGNGGLGKKQRGASRWITYVDQESGEEHVIRR
ncbi:hypothetical protein NMG60_11023022 [Bertholletia excelsa]